MDFKGTVTGVDTVFCCFNIAEQRIHLSLLISNNPKIGLPKLGSTVAVQKAFNNTLSLIASNESQLEYASFCVAPSSMNFLHVIKRFDLGTSDMYAIDKLLNVLEYNFKKLTSELKHEIVIAYCQLIFGIRKFQNCDLISVSTCRSVELKKEYSGFPVWSFGVHHKPNRNSILFGYLEVFPAYGFLILKDSSYGMPCVIYNIAKKNILADSFVLIKEYKVITEIYQDSENFEYLFVDFEDITILYLPTVSIYPVIATSLDLIEPKCEYCLVFKIILKSEISIGNAGKPEYWLQVQLMSKNDVDCDEMIFLLLQKEFIKIRIHLKLKQCYKLFYNNELIEIRNHYEIGRIAKYKMYELTDETARFQMLDIKERAESDYLTVEECKEYLKTKSDMVSFEGVICIRKFKDALSSRSFKRHQNRYGFGLPGDKSNEVVISSKNDKQCHLSWYLNNWENTFMPFGMIPEVRIIVRNVLPQSKKYFKSCIFTSVEVVAYEPAVNFRTVNLYNELYLGWGPRFFLGQGLHIPPGVLISGLVLKIRILSIKWAYICKRCRTKLLEPMLACPKCQTSEKLRDFVLILYVSDQYGQSKVLVKDVNFLKFILNMPEKPFRNWLEAFEQMDSFTFTIQGDEDLMAAKNDYHDVFKKVLYEYLEMFDKYEMRKFILKCRRLDSDPVTNRGHSFWYYIDTQSCN